MKTPTKTHTIFILAGGLAILSLLPFISQAFDLDWLWTQNLFFRIISTGIAYMSIFFHEIGHSIVSLLFGYPALPSFDLQNGGGMTYWTFTQYKILIAATFAGLLFLLWHCRASRPLFLGIAVALICYIFLVFHENEHKALISFMGHGFESLVAGFFLYRALYDLAPNGVLERWLNAYFGISFSLHSFIDGIALLGNADHRSAYYQQKGAHGFGDFDKIANSLTFLNFENSIIIWIVFSMLCVLIPIFLFLKFHWQTRNVLRNRYKNIPISDIQTTDDPTKNSSDDDDFKPYSF